MTTQTKVLISAGVAAASFILYRIYQNKKESKNTEEKSEFIAKKTTKIQSNDGYYCYNPKTNSGYFSLKPCEEDFIDITADM